MNDYPLSPRPVSGFNIIGMATLARKETGRFLNVYLQTLVAPVITTLLFYTVFALAFGGLQRTVGELPYMEFLAPGLIMMTMVQNAFANTSSSIIISKVQGNIVDVLMPPLGGMELLAGYVVGGVLRGCLVGLACGAATAFVTDIHVHSLVDLVLYALLGNTMLALLGIAGALWAEKFDHIAAVTNFLVTPMTFLSGTFYSISMLPGVWRDIAHLNPFFHMIDGFRYALTGHMDGNLSIGLPMLTVADVLLALLVYWMFRTGYKTRS